MDLHGIMAKGVFILSRSQQEQERQYLATLKDGTRVKKTYKRESRIKSSNQVKAHFGLVVEMIRQKLIEDGWAICGVAPDKNMVHEILKRSCGGVGDMGQSMGLSEMSMTQASKFFENCRNWAASELSLVIPDPDPNWKDSKNDLP